MHFEENPTMGNFPGEHGVVRYGEGMLIGYRWYDAHRLPVAYPFGHGLSYTTFSYAGLSVELRSDGPDPRVTVSVSVSNTGDRSGTETVQIYITDPSSSVFRPDQELRAFTRVELQPGETQRVYLELDSRAFAYWDTIRGRFVVEGGTFQVRVGASSRDIRATQNVELQGENLVPELAAESTAETWFAGPEAGPWLRQRVDNHPFAAMLFDPQLGKMMRAIPLVRLARFPGSPISEADIEEMVNRVSAHSRLASD